MSTTQEKNCCKECLICSNPQEYKINYVELHGVCSVHKTNSQNIQICKICKSKVPHLFNEEIQNPDRIKFEEKTNQCLFCESETKNKKHNCGNYICDNCLSFSNKCPSCFPISLLDTNSDDLIKENKQDLTEINYKSTVNKTESKFMPGLNFGQKPERINSFMVNNPETKDRNLDTLNKSEFYEEIDRELIKPIVSMVQVKDAEEKGMVFTLNQSEKTNISSFIVYFCSCMNPKT